MAANFLGVRLVISSDLATKVQTEADLDQAARLFADTMISGVNIARAIFTRSSSQHEPSSVFRAKAKGGAGGGKKPTFSKGEPQSKAPTAPKKPAGPRTEIDPKRTGHIFRKDEGHVPDTPANRKKLEDVANKDGTQLGTDKFGNVWHAETQPDGTQVWTQSRNGKIINGGVNQTPQTYNPETGLSSPTKPGHKK